MKQNAFLCARSGKLNPGQGEERVARTNSSLLARAGRPWGKANRKGPEEADFTEPQLWQGEQRIHVGRGTKCWQHIKCWKEGGRCHPKKSRQSQEPEEEKLEGAELAGDRGGGRKRAGRPRGQAAHRPVGSHCVFPGTPALFALASESQSLGVLMKAVVLSILLPPKV